MGEFVRILTVSKTVAVSVQLLQTMSIMIQNLTSDQAICELHHFLFVHYLIMTLFMIFIFFVLETHCRLLVQ